MKKILIIISLLFFLPTIAQKQKAILFFKDGTELKGRAKISPTGKIKFRKSKGAEKQFFSSKELKSIIIREFDKDVVYKYKLIEERKTILLLEVLEEGKVTLYRTLRSGYVAGATGPNGIPMGGHSYSISNYYVSKGNKNLVVHLGARGTIFSKNFKEAASDYFKDCTTLVGKIQSKELKKRDIVEIVEFYNENCD